MQNKKKMAVLLLFKMHWNNTAAWQPYFCLKNRRICSKGFKRLNKICTPKTSINSSAFIFIEIYLE